MSSFHFDLDPEFKSPSITTKNDLNLLDLVQKQELSTSPRPLVVTFPNSSISKELIKRAFKSKYTPYSISVDRTVE